ncbi:MAG: ATP-binding protein [Phycisphaeraceae bacterium]|nr:ATP-binding protein [Phycisphaeraceae bacterium]
MNYRSCTNVVLDLVPNVVAIIGKNGAGKSNLLKGIDHAATIASSQNPIDLNWLSSNNDTFSSSMTIADSDGEYSYTISSILVTLSDSSKETLGLHERLVFKDHAGTEAILIHRQGELAEFPTAGIAIGINHRMPAMSAVLSMFPNKHEQLLKIRRVRDILLSVQYYPLEEPASGTLMIPASYFEQWANEYEIEGNPSKSVLLRLVYASQRSPGIFDEINSLLGDNGLDLLKSIDVVKVELPKPRQSQASGGSPDTETNYSVFFTPSDSLAGAGESFQFLDLSVGTRRIIRLITSLIFDKRSVMLIEQPEDSINLSVIHKVLSLLRSYSQSTKIIFSTHSPEILDMLDPTEIRIVHAVNGSTVVHSLSEADVEHARQFLRSDGLLSEYIESLE